MHDNFTAPIGKAAHLKVSQTKNPMTLVFISFIWRFYQNHLAEKDLIHRDLAARNILVGSDNRVKVSDFGLMREIYEDMNTTGEKSTKLPLKWMAPESIFYQSFSIKSDT